VLFIFWVNFDEYLTKQRFFLDNIYLLTFPNFWSRYQVYARLYIYIYSVVLYYNIVHEYFKQALHRKYRQTGEGLMSIGAIDSLVFDEIHFRTTIGRRCANFISDRVVSRCTSIVIFKTIALIRVRNRRLNA